MTLEEGQAMARMIAKHSWHLVIILGMLSCDDNVREVLLEAEGVTSWRPALAFQLDLPVLCLQTAGPRGCSVLVRARPSVAVAIGQVAL